MTKDTRSFEDISVRGVWRELFKNLWMIVVLAASVWLGAAGLGKLTYTPEYTVSATVSVGVKGNQDTYASLTTASQIASTIGEIFQSDVMKELNADETGENAQVSIECSQVPETNLLVINAVAQNPADAYKFLNSALQNYDEVSQYLFANATLQILQEPSVPTKPSNQPRFSEYKNQMALLGAALMAAIIVLFYWLRFTLKRSSSAEKQLDGTVMGVIPFEKRKRDEKNKKEGILITSPIVSMGYAESNRKTAARIEHYLDRNQQKILLVTSVSENEGKSTVAANIALALTEKYKKVLLVDGDFRKPAQYKIFEKPKTKENPLEGFLSGTVGMKDAVKYNEKTGLYELFLNRAVKYPERLLQPSELGRLMESLSSEMDYVIIDCSPTMVSTDAEVWMQVAESAVLVVRQDWSDIRVINDMVDVVWQSGCNLAGFVLNAFQEEGGRNAYGYGSYRPSKYPAARGDS